MKNIVVGTAGYIDHGKTALVKALTGIDADRLEEEKRRGITSILAECRDRGELVDYDVSRVARAIQQAIYALKDRPYARTQFEYGSAADSKIAAPAGTVSDILDIVSLTLDGIVKARNKGGLE
jgi:hypothetical protein